MNTKKILAMVVALAMIVAVVPTFGLVASADGADGYIPADATAEFAYVSGSYGDSVIEAQAGWENWVTGWTAPNNEADSGKVNVNLAGDRIQWYGGATTEGAITFTAPYAAGKDYFIIDFYATANNNGEAHDVALYDADGAIITTYRFAADGISSEVAVESYPDAPVAVEATEGKMALNQTVRIFVENISDTQYKVSIGNNDGIVNTRTYDGQVNGLGKINHKVAVKGDAWYRNVSYGNINIYGGNFPDATSSVTVNFVTDSGETVGEAKVINNVAVGVPYEYKDAAAEYVAEDFSAYYKLDAESAKLANVDADAAKNVINVTYKKIAFAEANVPAAGTQFTDVDGKVYKVIEGAKNLVPNPSFETAEGFDTTGWYSGNGGVANTTVYPEAHRFDVTDATAGNHSFGSRYGDAWNQLCSILNSFKVEANKTYLFSYDVKLNVSDPRTDASVSIGIAESATGVSVNNDQKTTENISGISQEEWTTKSRLVTVGEVADPYIQFNAYRIGNAANGGDGAKFLFDNFVLVEVEQDLSATTNPVSIKNALDALEVVSMTKGADIELAKEATDSFGTKLNVTWTSDNEAVNAETGAVTPAANVVKATLTPSVEFDGEAITGTAHTVTVFPASLAGKEYKATDATYTVGTENLLPFEALTVASDKTTLVTASDKWKTETVGDVTTVTTTGSEGSSGAVSIRKTLTLTPNTKYLIALTSKSLPGGQYNSLWTGGNNDPRLGDFKATSDWTREIVVFDSADYTSVDLVLAWLTTNSTSIQNVEMFTLTEQEETLVSVANPADVAVATGTAPVLPATVDGTYSKGSVKPVAVTWNTEGLDFTNDSDEVKTVTVPGVAEGMDVSVNVNVYYSYAVEGEVNSVNGQGAAAKAPVSFPVPATDKVTVEFDAEFASFGDLWIQINNAASVYSNGNGAFFGSGQANIGFNGNAALRPVNGDGNGGRTSPDADAATLETNKAYKFFVNVDVAAHKYTVTIYDAVTGDQVAQVADFGFRKNADSVDALYFFTNNGQGAIKASNIKVTYAYVAPTAPEAQVTFNETVAMPRYVNGAYNLVFEANVNIPDGRTVEKVGFKYGAAQKDEATGVYNVMPELTSTEEKAFESPIFRLAIKDIKGANALRNYYAKPFAVLDDGTTVEGEVSSARIISTLAEALEAETLEVPIITEKADAFRALVPVVVSEGAVADKANPDATDALAKLMVKTDNTIELSELAKTNAIYFTTETAVVVDGVKVELTGEAGKFYTKVVLGEGTATLDGAVEALPEAVEVVALESVEVEEVSDVIEETIADDSYETVSDFEEIL